MLSNAIIDLLLPETEKYMLWSAASNQSLFSFISNDKKYRVHKNRETNEEVINDWNNIWKIIELNKSRKKNLEELCTFLKEEKIKMKDKVHKFLNIKNELLQQAAYIGQLIEMKYLYLFSPIQIVDIFAWIDSVIIKLNNIIINRKSILLKYQQKTYLK